METKTISYNLLGHNLTLEFIYYEEGHVKETTITSEKDYKNITYILKTKSFDDKHKAEVKRNLIKSLLIQILVDKYENFILIDKIGELSLDRVKINWAKVSDNDLEDIISEYHDEIQLVANELFKEFINFAETL